MPPSRNITFEELSQFFHLPINQVAKELGVCATILKKICRRNGIPRWPHRKIKSIDKMIANLEMNLAKNPNEKEEIHQEVQLLRGKKVEILQNPTVISPVNTLKAPTVQLKKSKQQKAMHALESFKYGTPDISTYDLSPHPPSPTRDRINDLFVLLNESHAPSMPSKPATPPQVISPSTSPLVISAASTLSDLSTVATAVTTPNKEVNKETPMMSGPSYPFTTPAPRPVAAQLDYTRSLPAFTFSGETERPAVVLRSSCSQYALPSASQSSSLPAWFLEEKNRVFGTNM
eukprot:TRINITY_DN1559_c0_g1_i1.p1 TRINITY_DN1559_c0_g1~~TRINITY_DN1559_c0_g1_i1.p1  ORF type:complete len:289 (-),score=43.53 TRINITY_DN1559_c0_g1_i1:101-967(-)